MKLQESGEMYLETILILQQKSKGREVRAIDVGEELGFSKPSVSRAMKILTEAGYVEHTGTGALLLTEAGRKIAESTLERHETLTKLFQSIGVSAETAEEDACRIEHVISEETFLALKRHAEQFVK